MVCKYEHIIFVRSKVMCRTIVLKDRDSLNDRMVHVSKCWGAGLLALVCGVCCGFVTFPLVSWFRCGTDCIDS